MLSGLGWWTSPRPVRTLQLGCATALLLFGIARPASAQTVDQYFPAGTSGRATEPGVTVLSRARPAYQEPGIHFGSFLFHAHLDESLGYDSNILGLPNGQGSSVVATSAGASATSLWGRNQLGAAVSVDNFRYLGVSRQSYTNWTAALGGGYTIGRHDLILAYSHVSSHETAAQVGALPSDTPVPFDVDTLHGSYTFDLGRISLTPAVDAQLYSFSDTSIGGIPVSQAYRDRVVLTESITARYALDEQSGLLLVTRGIQSRYTRPQPGQPTYNSNSWEVMGGIDYQAEGPWRYRLLVGVESRVFAFSGFATHTAPVISGQVIWTPTGLTTVTAEVSRTIEDPAAEGASGYTYTNAGIVVDHELRRNILLQGRLSYERADELQGGGVTDGVSVGGRVTWLLSRRVRLSLDDTFTYQTGTSAFSPVYPFNLGLPGGSSFTRNIALLTLRLAL